MTYDPYSYHIKGYSVDYICNDAQADKRIGTRALGGKYDIGVG